MKKILCDRCGIIIWGNPIKLIPVIETQPGSTAEKAPHENEQVERDYCPECLEKIIAFANENATLNEGRNKRKAKREQNEKEAKKDEPLDVGKILALRKAGWTQAKIADEMGTSQSRISGVIRKYTVFEKTSDEESGE